MSEALSDFGQFVWGVVIGLELKILWGLLWSHDSDDNGYA